MRLIRCVLASLVFAGAMLLAGASAVRADDACQRRIVKADHKLHEAVDKHGWKSSQAEHWRHELADARAYCWEHWPPLVMTKMVIAGTPSAIGMITITTTIATMTTTMITTTIDFPLS